MENHWSQWPLHDKYGQQRPKIGSNLLLTSPYLQHWLCIWRRKNFSHYNFMKKSLCALLDSSRRDLHEGGGTVWNRKKTEQKRREENQRFKKGSKLGQGVGVLKRRGWNSLRNYAILKQTKEFLLLDKKLKGKIVLQHSIQYQDSSQFWR